MKNYIIGIYDVSLHFDLNFRKMVAMTILKSKGDKISPYFTPLSELISSSKVLP